MGCCNGHRKTTVPYKIKEAVLTVSNVLSHAIRTGEISADKGIIERRLAVCQSCSHLQGSRCDICGCFMHLKAGLVATNCPIKKW